MYIESSLLRTYNMKNAFFQIFKLLDVEASYYIRV